MINTLLDLLQIFRDLGDREALVHFNGFKTEKLSYKQLLGRIGSVQSLLLSKGISSGSRVAILGSNRPEWVFSFWACISIGAEIIPLDTGFSPGLNRKILDNTKSNLLIMEEGIGHDYDSLETIYFDQIGSSRSNHPIDTAKILPEDIVEIIFTSGATGDPKGVIHRHQNICANLNPFRKEFNRYRTYARPFQPIRILDLLPLSHMFGQAMGIFIPGLLGGSVALTSLQDPRRITRFIQKERISVLASIPRFLLQLESYLRDVTGKQQIRTPRYRGIAGIIERWLRFRKLHRQLGWKFWAVVVGGAPVPPKMENFWSNIGILLIQGYGLTEASPIVAVNHPFHTRSGAIGKVLNGQEVKLSDQGEILVRGKNVQTEYLQIDGSVIPATKNGWLHTGDIGERDSDGNLFYRGRIKEMIVTSEGQNVYPEDVESILNQNQGVMESAVIGKEAELGTEVHAVLVLLDPGIRAEPIIKEANRQLLRHQRIRSWTVRQTPLPRTSSTQKLRRSQIASEVSGPMIQSPTSPNRDLTFESVLSRISGFSQETITDETTLDYDLGIGSLDRIELLDALEKVKGSSIDEAAFSQKKTIKELRDLVKRTLNSEEENRRGWDTVDELGYFPQWSTRFPFSILRRLFQALIMLPLFRHYMDMTVSGIELVNLVPPPFLLAANHSSHLDVVAILAALPTSIRVRVAPAVRQEYFQAHFFPLGFSFFTRINSSFKYYLACLLFNTFPLPQKSSGVRRTLRYTGLIVSRGFCPLIFPEGMRTPDGSLRVFRPGIGLMAKSLELPVIPVHLSGLFEVFPVHAQWPKRGPIHVRVGEPIFPGRMEEASDFTLRLEDEISRLSRQ